jgi:hypothetical protein
MISNVNLVAGLIERQRKEILEIVEIIMHPQTSEEERVRLGAIYENKRRTFLSVGGKFYDDIATNS